jgi:hypothetical protein
MIYIYIPRTPVLNVQALVYIWSMGNELPRIAYSRQPGYASSTAAHPPKAGRIGQSVDARRSIALCPAPTCSPPIQGSDFGGATAALLLPSPRCSCRRLFYFLRICRQKKEPTSGPEPLTYNLITSDNSCVAGDCALLRIPHI